jgi:transcriptional regulator with XRE-family HTH domain
MAFHKDIGSILSGLREAAGLTQKQIAERLGIHQSKISRLEAGEGEPGKSDCSAFLRAIGSAEAKRVRRAIEAKWKHLPQPPLHHPDLEIMLEAEAALDRLDAFAKSDTVPHVLAGQAELLFKRLFEFGEFILKLEHRIVYVGEIGVGKTTAACRQAGLVANTSASADLKGMMLDTGGGRTTLCDVYVQKGDRFSLEVEPLPDEEVYRLVEEFCRSLMKRQDTGPGSLAGAEFKLPEEVERALRNLAELPRPLRRKSGPQDTDPAIRLSEGREFSDFKADVSSRLSLWRRTRRVIEFEGADHLLGRQWLKETFTAINNGRHADFSMPGRITITVPFSIMADTPFNVSLVDTRGVDGSAVRPDLLAHLKDARSVTLLCSKWGSAPDPSLQDVLKHVVETAADPDLLSRVGMLVVARAGDAHSMRHDSGEGAQDVSEGYDIKRGQVEDAFLRIGLNEVNICLFDAANDDPADLTDFLAQKIVALRAARAEHVKATIVAIDQMLDNVEKAQVLATFEAVNKELQLFAQRHRALKGKSKPLQNRLTEAIHSRHPRTVWAATRRGGSFWNFDVYQHLGDAAAADAIRRCGAAVDGLREIIKNKLADDSLESAHSFLAELLDGVRSWKRDFVEAARHYAIEVYRPQLSAAEDLWSQSERKYGLGLDYREEVAGALAEWFDKNEDLQEQFDQLLQRAWRATVMKPLREASGNSMPLVESE